MLHVLVSTKGAYPRCLYTVIQKRSAIASDDLWLIRNPYSVSTTTRFTNTAVTFAASPHTNWPTWSLTTSSRDARRTLVLINPPTCDDTRNSPVSVRRAPICISDEALTLIDQSHPPLNGLAHTLHSHEFNVASRSRLARINSRSIVSGRTSSPRQIGRESTWRFFHDDDFSDARGQSCEEFILARRFREAFTLWERLRFDQVSLNRRFLRPVDGQPRGRPQGRGAGPNRNVLRFHISVDSLESPGANDARSWSLRSREIAIRSPRSSDTHVESRRKRAEDRERWSSRG